MAICPNNIPCLKLSVRYGIIRYSNDERKKQDKIMQEGYIAPPPGLRHL
jgi:hypothetical protein